MTDLKLKLAIASCVVTLVSSCAENASTDSSRRGASGSAIESNNAGESTPARDIELTQNNPVGRVIDLSEIEPKLLDPSLKDTKIYFSNEASPKLAFVGTTRTNEQGKLSFFGRQDPTGAWQIGDVSELPGSPLAGKGVKGAGDVHLRYSRDGASAWLTFGGCIGTDCQPRGLELTPDLSRVTKMANLDRCGHEPQIVCNTKDDCLGLGVCDAVESDIFGTSLKRIANGVECPSFRDLDLRLAARINSGFGQVMTARGNGEFDFYYVQATLPELFFKKESIYVSRLKFAPGQCKPSVLSTGVASAAPVKVGGAIYPPLAKEAALVPYAAVGWTNAVNPSTGRGWQAQQDTTPVASDIATRFYLVPLDAAGKFQGVSIPVIPPNGYHNLSPAVEFDASTNDFYVFYYQFKMGGDPSYRVCYRSLKRNNWLTESCPVSATYKDIRKNVDKVNAQNIIENNHKVGAVSNGKIALLFQDQCEGMELGDAAVCRLKVWTND